MPDARLLMWLYKCYALVQCVALRPHQMVEKWFFGRSTNWKLPVYLTKIYNTYNFHYAENQKLNII